MSYYRTERIPSPANNPIKSCVHCETETRYLSRSQDPTCSVCLILIKRNEPPQTLETRIQDKGEGKTEIKNSEPDIFIYGAASKLPKEYLLQRVREWDQQRRAVGFDMLPAADRKKMSILARKVGYRKSPFRSIRSTGRRTGGDV